MTFCAAPFVHMVHNPDSQYRTCCMYEKPLKGKYKNIQEAFDSEESADNGIYTFKFNELDIVRSKILRYIVKVLQQLKMES